MSSLLSLPVELIARIGEFTDPNTHLDLGCTCKYIAGCLDDIFKRHRTAYTKSACSDLHPLTIPQVLRKVISDPIAAHHLRTIHIWCARSKWDEWRPFRMQPTPDSQELFGSYQGLCSWSFIPGEVESYLAILASHVDHFGEGSELREEARDELATGGDGVLKALLIILCPRLKTLYYSRSRFVDIEYNEGAFSDPSLTWLHKIILCHRGKKLESWPAGLRSLRHIAIGVETGTRIDGEPRQSYHPSSMAAFLNLPNLESIYWRGLGQGLELEQNAGFPLVAGCSSVRHIYLEDVCEIGREFWYQVVKACKAQLTSVTFHGGALCDTDSYISAAQSPNLQSMILYMPPGTDFSGYRCGLGYPSEVLGRNLRVVTVDPADIALEAGCNDGTKYCGPRRGLIKHVIGFLNGLPFPRQLEVLVLTGNLTRLSLYLLAEEWKTTSFDEMADWMDDALAAMISWTDADRRKFRKMLERDEAKVRKAEAEGKVAGSLRENSSSEDVGEEERKEQPQDIAGKLQDEIVDELTEAPGGPQAEIQHQDDEEYGIGEDDTGADSASSSDDYEPEHLYPRLKVIYIEPFGQYTSVTPPSRLWMQKSIKAGIERGVDVRTRTNVNPPMHTDIQLPMAPSRFDLRSDITPPTNQEFDPKQGVWIDRGCGNCGDCDECFALFPQELWAQAYRAPQEPVKKVEPVKEVWTRFRRDDSRETGHHVQQLDEYVRDRRCAGKDILGEPDGEYPPIGFLETARQHLEGRRR